MKTIYVFRLLLVLALSGLGVPAAMAGDACGAPSCGTPGCGQPCGCDPCCGDLSQFCQCDCGVRKICVKQCDTKKKEYTCYMGKCEDFCLPDCCPRPGPLAWLLRRCGAGGGCGDSCTEPSCGGVDPGCGCPDPCNGDGCVRCSCGPESCGAKLRLRKKLYRRKVEVENPVAKWVAEPVCAPGCGGGDPCTSATAPGIEELPEDIQKEDETDDESMAIPPAPLPSKSARAVPGFLQTKARKAHAARHQIRNPVVKPRSDSAHVRPVAFQSVVKRVLAPKATAGERSIKPRDKNFLVELFE